MADEEGPTISDSQLQAEVNARSTEVTGLLNKRDKVKALISSLKNPPVLAKAPEIKDTNAATIEKVLAAMTEAEVNTAIDSMDMETVEILLKYVYRFMGKNVNCGLMLKLHATLSDKAGMGSIVRVLTDRKQV